MGCESWFYSCKGDWSCGSSWLRDWVSLFRKDGKQRIQILVEILKSSSVRQKNC